MGYKKIVVFSGAGLDAESGVPTFRDSNGLWENHKVEDVCNISTWLDNYELVHKFYDDRREALKTVYPNLAHAFIKHWQTKWTCLSVTTNISDLLERAGVVDNVHLHGYLPEVYCIECKHKHNIGYNRVYEDIDGTKIFNEKLSPWESHGKCSFFEQFDINKIPDIDIKTFKPNVVFFGEMAPMYNTLYSIVDVCDHETVAIVVGASNIVIDFISLLATKPSKLIVVDPKPSVTADSLYGNYHIIKKTATEGFKEVDAMLSEIMDDN